MAITLGYSTRDEVKDWIGVEVDQFDLKLDNVVTSVSRWIDNYCQRHFWQTSANTVRVFESPCDLRLLRFGPFNDLATFASLKTDEAGDGTFETTWSASDYELLPLNPAGAPEQRPYTKIRATGTGRWFPVQTCTGRIARIEVTGTWGWPAVPEDVKQACLIQAHRIFNRPNSPTGMIGFADFGVVRMQGRLDPDVAAMLDPYRLTAVLVA